MPTCSSPRPMPPSSYRDDFALLMRETLYAHGAVVQLQMALALAEENGNREGLADEQR